MKSAFAITYEVLDMQQAAEELRQGVAGLELQANSLGILFCDSELPDYPGLLRSLKAKLGFDIIGCTSVATLNKKEGISEMSSSLLVLTADDCRFHAGLTAPLSRDNVREEITKTYRETAAKLQGEAKLILTYSPYTLEIMIDAYPEILSEVSGDVPVFGGVPGYNAPYGLNDVIYNDNIYTDRLALVIVEGNLRPVFAIGVELSHRVEGSCTVTDSEENLIRSIDGMSMPEYLASMGIDAERMAADETDILFVSNPFMLTKEGVPEEEYKLIRTFHKLDMETGHGVSLARVPQGHQISLGTLTRQDVADSAQVGVEKLLQQIKEHEAADPSYRYSTIIATSCAGRYMVMSPNVEVEGDVFTRLIPEHCSFIGYYSYGEFGPTSIHNGKAINTAQNESLTLCAF